MTSACCFDFFAKVLVPGNVNNAFLDGLIQDTPYRVNVVAMYPDGEGLSLKSNGKTCEDNVGGLTSRTPMLEIDVVQLLKEGRRIFFEAEKSF